MCQRAKLMNVRSWCSCGHITKGQLKTTHNPLHLPSSSLPNTSPPSRQWNCGLNGSAARKGLTLGIDNNCWKLPKVTKTAVSIAATKPTHTHTTYTRTTLHPPSPLAHPVAQLAFLITRRASGLLSLSNKQQQRHQQQQQQAQPFRPFTGHSDFQPLAWDLG